MEQIEPQTQPIMNEGLGGLRPRIARLKRVLVVCGCTGVALGLHTDGSGATVWSAALFGLALSAFLLSPGVSWLVVSAGAVAVYRAAVLLARPVFGVEAFAVVPFVPSAIFGAVAMCALTAIWDRRYWRAIPLAAGVGAVAGLVFPFASMSTMLVVPHLVWQVLVGGALVDWAMRRAIIPTTATVDAMKGTSLTVGLASMAVVLSFLPSARTLSSPSQAPTSEASDAPSAGAGVVTADASPPAGPSDDELRARLEAIDAPVSSRTDEELERELAMIEREVELEQASLSALDAELAKQQAKVRADERALTQAQSELEALEREREELHREGADGGR